MAITPPQDENQSQSADRYTGQSKAKTRIGSWGDFGRCLCPVAFFNSLFLSSFFILYSFHFSAYGVCVGCLLVGTFYLVLLGIALRISA